MKGHQLNVAALVSAMLVAGCASTPDMPRQEQAPAMQCGQADIALDLNEDGDWLELTHLDNVIELERIASASGARYQLPDNADTWFWSQGDTATLSLDGVTYPTCVAAGGMVKPFTATGNEPFWRLIIEPGQLVLERLDQPTLELRYETVAESRFGRTFTAKDDDHAISVLAAPQLCRDSMSGMPHPFQIRLTLNGDVLSGCGGEPDRLLMGDPWLVEDIGGRGVIDRSRVTVQFLPEGRVIGTGSCNRYTGDWTLDGESIEVSQLASTRRACAPALMNQEDRFLKLLQEVRRFDIKPTGALELQIDGVKPIRAFQVTQ